MATKKLEFICLANSGRSEPARIIAQDYLEQQGLADQYAAISSGTSVDDIAAGHESPSFKVQIIRKGVKRGIYGGQEAVVVAMLGNSDVEVSARYHADPTYCAAVDEYFGSAKQVFKAEEHANRVAALKEIGLEGKLKVAPEQTVARADVIVVLPMARTNRDKAQQIYDAAGHTPIIDSLKAYVTGNPADEVANAFGEPAAVYHQMFDELRGLVPYAVDKAIAQYEKR